MTTYPVLCVMQPVKENFTKVYKVIGYFQPRRTRSFALISEILFESESLMSAQLKLKHFLEHEANYVHATPFDTTRYVKFVIESYWKSTPKEEYKIVPEVFYAE